jgi:chemotaxis protein MotB
MEEQQKCKCPAGIPAWVLTFADLMSLLMCFFVLLLSFAEMDVLKFKQIAGSLKVAFGVQRDIRAVEIPKGVNIVAKEFSPAPPQPTVINEVRQKTIDDTNQELKLIEKREQLQDEENELKDKMENMSEAEAESEGLKKKLQEVQAEKAEVEEKLEELQEKMNQIQQQKITETAAQLTAALQSEIEAEMIEVEANEESITIRIRENGSFAPGSARLTDDFIEILEIIAEELVSVPGDIVVTGHTDDIPINTERFRSNWALSSARAVAVTHELLLDDRLDKGRFSIQAFADSKPLMDNDTPENRAINRRVEIIVSQNKQELGISEGTVEEQTQAGKPAASTSQAGPAGSASTTSGSSGRTTTSTSNNDDDEPVPSFIQF